MSLTERGLKALKDFKEKYGKKEGEKIFYAFINKHPTLTRKWHNSN